MNDVCVCVSVRKCQYFKLNKQQQSYLQQKKEFEGEEREVIGEKDNVIREMIYGFV